MANNKESGLVSILTVIMFMIFISILVVGFIKIMTDEQRQATDNDLSASALAAAQSGVEDGKRVILYCLGNGLTGSEPAQCNNLFSSGNSANPCDSFKNGAKGLFQSMNIPYDVTGKEAQVGEPSFNQYYTCLSVDPTPNDLVKTITSQRSEIIPLTTTGTFDRLDISWTSTQSSYGSKTPSPGSDFPALGAWNDGSGKPLPPVLRVQLIPYTPGTINLSVTQQRSDTFFLVPASGGATTNTVNRLTIDDRTVSGFYRNAPLPIVYTDCTLNAGTGGYYCPMQISGLNSSAEQYYLRLSLFYAASTEVTIKAFDTASNTARDFDKVQYVIDVTGRTNDVYRRIQARVSPQSSTLYPEYAIDSAGSICKDITVADLANTTYNCP